MQLRRFLSNLAKTCLAISALSVPAFAGADEIVSYGGSGPAFPPSYSSCCSPSCPPSCCPPSCCPQSNCCGFPCCPAPDCGWGYNPPAYPRCCCDFDCCNNDNSFGFRADFLWWRVCEEGLELGREESVVKTTSGLESDSCTLKNVSREKRPNFKYDPGFRIGFAHFCACDCWDFAVNWTHFRSKSHVHGRSHGDTKFFSSWERLEEAVPGFAKGQYVLSLDLVDIEFGRKFYVSNCFVLRPEFGIRIARINQNFKVFATAEEDHKSSDPFCKFNSHSKSRSDFIAAGPRIGSDIELRLNCGLTLFGCGAASIVFGKFDNHSREHFKDPHAKNDSPSDFQYFQKSSAHRCSRAITDLAFGVKWDHCFEWCNRCHPVSLAFAWEHHAFFDMNNFNFRERGFDYWVQDPAHRKHGDLFTQGLTVSLVFGF